MSSVWKSIVVNKTLLQAKLELTLLGVVMLFTLWNKLKKKKNLSYITAFQILVATFGWMPGVCQNLTNVVKHKENSRSYS